jgi:hypothetical protein
LTRAVIDARPGGEVLAGAMLLPSSGMPPALHASLVDEMPALLNANIECADVMRLLALSGMRMSEH